MKQTNKSFFFVTGRIVKFFKYSKVFSFFLYSFYIRDYQVSNEKEQNRFIQQQQQKSTHVYNVDKIDEHWNTSFLYIMEYSMSWTTTTKIHLVNVIWWCGGSFKLIAHTHTKCLKQFFL